MQFVQILGCRIRFRTLNSDHLGPFVTSKRRNVYIIAVSDPLSEILAVKAVRNANTQPVITVLIELTAFFGLPERIISDRAIGFTSRVFASYCENNIATGPEDLMAKWKGQSIHFVFR